MRIIKEMVRSILKLIFHIDTESPVEELLRDRVAKSQLRSLLDLVDSGHINDAEEQLFDMIDENNLDSLQMALIFYSYLNDQSDDFLTEHDFSREEVKSGLSEVVSMFGLEGIVDAYMI
ncbi:MAG: DUF6483 family protein [Clostridiales bacterium]|nr:DUF6483 family protein [Clostridiales bacterium]